jgi:HEAT repeat protein
LIKRILVVSGTLAILISNQNAKGAVPKKQIGTPIEKILSKKSITKFEELRDLGPEVYPELRKMAFDEKRHLKVRWSAFMAMVRLGEKESLPEVAEALKSRDWYLRMAAIRVLPALDKEQAYKAALKGLDDSALVVRTAAVDTLGILKRPQSAGSLWAELYSKDSYIKKSSLWIRRHIVEALADLAPAGSEAKFIKVLDDSDSTLYAPAIKGLERLTGKKLGSADVPPVYKRHFWKKWYQESQVLLKKSTAS